MNPLRLLRAVAVVGVAAALAGAGVSAIRDTPATGPGAAPRTPAPTITASPTPTTSPTRAASGPSARPRIPGVMPTTEPVAGSACGAAKAPRVVRWRVEVDRAVAVPPATFAAQVASVICNERSWIAGGEVRFVHDPRGRLLIGLRTAAEAERRCYRLIRLSVNHRWSCGTPREVVINADRWKRGSEPWPGPLGEYRRMLMNHEVGHALGLHHEQCPADGAPAPVMMQQSKGMTTPNGQTCKPNPWPLASEIARLSRS